MAHPLRNKILVMIIGPSATGKSSLMNRVVKHDNEFARISGFTTRQPRPNDEPGLYRYLSVDAAQSLIQSGAYVQYAIHPSTGDIYGTELRDYPAQYNLKDTLTDAVEPFRKLPFARTVAISLTAPAEDWKRWFKVRYPEKTEEATKRLDEAVRSIEWSLAQRNDHYWLINRDSELDACADKLISCATQQDKGDDGRRHAEAMLRLIQSGVWAT